MESNLILVAVQFTLFGAAITLLLISVYFGFVKRDYEQAWPLSLLAGLIFFLSTLPRMLGK